MNFDPSIAVYTAPYYQRGTDLYYALLGLEKNEQEKVILLYTLNETLRTIPYQRSDDSILRGKLGWWQEEIRRFTEKKAQHPLTQKLSHVLDNRDCLAKDYLHPWIEGLSTQIGLDHLCTEADLKGLAQREWGFSYHLIAETLGHKIDNSLITALAEVKSLCQHWTDIEADLQTHFCPFPLNALKSLNINWLTVNQKNDLKDLQTLLLHSFESLTIDYKATQKTYQKLPLDQKSSPLFLLTTFAFKRLQNRLKKGWPLTQCKTDLFAWEKISLALFS